MIRYLRVRFWRIVRHEHVAALPTEPTTGLIVCGKCLVPLGFARAVSGASLAELMRNVQETIARELNAERQRRAEDGD